MCGYANNCESPIYKSDLIVNWLTTIRCMLDIKLLENSEIYIDKLKLFNSNSLLKLHVANTK